MSVIEVLAQRIAKVEDDLKRWREEQYRWITEKDKVLQHVAFEGNTLVWRRDTKFTGAVAVEDSNLHIYGSRVGTGNLVVGLDWDAPILTRRMMRDSSEGSCYMMLQNILDWRSSWAS